MIQEQMIQIWTEHFDAGSLALLLCATVVQLMFAWPGLAITHAALMGRNCPSQLLQRAMLLVAVQSLAWCLLIYTLGFGPSWGTVPQADPNQVSEMLSLQETMRIEDAKVDERLQHGRGGFVGGLEYSGLEGFTPRTGPDRPVFPTRRPQHHLPHAAIVAFQLSLFLVGFAPLAVLVMDRLNLFATAVLAILWGSVVYGPVIHSVWGDGWLGRWGVLDHGGGLMQVAVGCGALATVLAFPRRVGDHPALAPAAEAADVTWAIIGAGIYWFASLLAQAALTYRADGRAALTLLNCQMGVSACVAAWLVADRLVWSKTCDRSPALAVITGVSAISAGCGYLITESAIIVGVVAGVAGNVALGLLARSGSAGARPIFVLHAVGGAIGVILTGVFATSSAAGGHWDGRPVMGLVEGNLLQVVQQSVAVGFAAVWGIGGTWLCVAIVCRFAGPRDHGQSATVVAGPFAGSGAAEAGNSDEVTELPGGAPPRQVTRLPVSGWLLAVCLSLSVGCSHSPSISDGDLLLQARTAMNRNDFSSAERSLRELLRRRPHDARALLYRAQLSRDQGDDAEALQWLSRIPDTAGKEAGTARFVEGTIAVGSHEARKAERLLQRAIDLNPTFTQPYERLIQLYAMQCRRDDLLNEFSRLSRVRPLTLPELALQITAGERLMAPEQGITDLQRFIDADGDDLHSRFSQGICFRDAYRFDEAIEAFEEILRREAGFSPARAALAQILIDRDRAAEAATILHDVDLSKPISPALWLTIGNLYAIGRDWEKAAGCFAVAARAEPLDRSAFAHLATALKRLGLEAESRMAGQRAAMLAELRDHTLSLGIMYSRQRVQATTVLRAAVLLSDLGDAERADLWREQGQVIDAKAAAGTVFPKASPLAEQIGFLNVCRRFQPASVVTPPGLMETVPVAAGDVRPSAIRLVDHGTDLGLDFQYFNGESGFKYIIESLGGGMGVIDFDSDGWPDLFLPQGGLMPPQPDPRWRDVLFRNLQGKRFEAVPESAGIGDLGYGLGLAVGDLDQDGFDDLIVGNYGRSTILMNRGDGTFADTTSRGGPSLVAMTTSVGCADFDRDGLLDLYFANYVDSLKVCRNDRGEIAVCSPFNFGGVQDQIYRNLGDGRFEEVSGSAGLLPGGKGLGVVLADFNDDGWTDIFVANDTTPNFLYINDAQPGALKFSEQGVAAGVSLGEGGVAQAGMGIACADFSGDLLLDLYVTYFYGEANGLYANDGNGLFQNTTRAAGLYASTLDRLGFGTQAVDLDGDGRLELFVANGHIDDQSAVGVPWKMSPQLFVARESGRYDDVSASAGDYFSERCLGRGVVKLDWNRDGLTDLAVAHQDRPPALLTNESPTAGTTLQLRLHGVASNRSAIGAKILVSTGGRVVRSDVLGGDGYLASNDRGLQIGLGKSSVADRVEIHWPNGRVDVFQDISADIAWKFIEGQQPSPVRVH